MTNAKADHAILSINQPKICEWILEVCQR
jgi:hypothetical protein